MEAVFFGLALSSFGLLAFTANQYVNGVDAVAKLSASLLQVELQDSKDEVTLKLKLLVSNANPVAQVKLDLIGFSIFAEEVNLGSKQEPFNNLFVAPKSDAELDLSYSLKGESAEKYRRTFPSKPLNWTVRARLYLSEPFRTSLIYDLTAGNNGSDG